MPEAVHASECRGVQGEKVSPVGEYREEQVMGKGHQGNVGGWSKGVLNAPGPLRSALIHTFGNFTENVDQGGSGWTRRTRGTITPLAGPGVVFTFC